METGSSRPAACPAAFTLLELLVVLTLMVILTGVIVPRIGRSVGIRELREAAARFALTARSVREFAVARGRTCAVEIDLDRGGYRVVTVASGPGTAGTAGEEDAQWETVRASWLKVQHWPKTVAVDSYRTPEGASKMGGTQYLKFFRDGTSSGAAIRLACGEDVYKIIVHPHSGRVTYGDPKTTAFGRDSYDLGD